MSINQVTFMKKPILCRDLTSRYAQIRRTYFAPSTYGPVSDDEEIELHYEGSSVVDNDSENPMDQQFAEGTSPLWYRVLTLVKVDIDSIKKYSKYLLIDVN